jgi:EAL domain-containing protein (putative c-di-GMP-specific phosphodiesterase class I)
LRDLSIDYLKIDGTYTRDLRPETLNHQVVTAVTAVSRILGFRVIAEQVETQADFEALRSIGVDFIQGNFIDRPHRLGEPNTTGSRWVPTRAAKPSRCRRCRPARGPASRSSPRTPAGR